MFKLLKNSITKIFKQGARIGPRIIAFATKARAFAKTPCSLSSEPAPI